MDAKDYLLDLLLHGDQKPTAPGIVHHKYESWAFDRQSNDALAIETYALGERIIHAESASLDYGLSGDSDAENAKPDEQMPDAKMPQQLLVKRNQAVTPRFARNNAASLAKRLPIKLQCRCGCNEKFSNSEKEEILSRFSTKSDVSVQNMYLARCVIPIAKRNKKPRNEELRTRSVFAYFVEVLRDHILHRIRVCHLAFISLHDIKSARLKHKVQPTRSNVREHRSRNHRGRRATYRPRTVAPYVYRMIRRHIASFPPREAYFSRKENIHKKFLDSQLNVCTMHRLFVELHPSLQSVTYNTYRHICKTFFDLSFGYPRSNVCKTCDQLMLKIGAARAEANGADKASQLENQLKQHVSKADVFYKQQAELARNADNSCAVIAMDFQRVLPLPVTEVTEYYKRQLWIEDLCIHDMKTNDASMYMYSEHFARKGANEVTSCLMHYISTLDVQITKLCIFCDNCLAQNKNRVLLSVLQHVVTNGRLHSIELFYPIPGHCRLPCDRNFALIEQRRIKTSKVSCPSEWVQIVRCARPRKPFSVVYVQHPLNDNVEDDGTPIVSVMDYEYALGDILAPSVSQLSRFRGIKLLATGVTARLGMFGDADTRIRLLKQGRSWASVAKAIRTAPLAYADFIPLPLRKYRDVMCLSSRLLLPPGTTFYDSIKSEDSESVRKEQKDYRV